MMRRRYRRWKAARTAHLERCETCRQPTKRPHEVDSTFGDEAEAAIRAEGGFGSGSSMTATYCPAHCPGGCQHQHKEKRHHAPSPA